MIASLGGFLGRKGDGEPGVKTIWLGLRRLHDISQTWKLSHQISPPHRTPLSHLAHFSLFVKFYVKKDVTNG